MQEEDASSDEEYRNAHGDELKAIALESSSPEPSETLPPFPSQGLRIEELRHLVASCPVGATTNFLCHEVVRQRTVAQGWVDVPSLTDAAKGYYSHTSQRFPRRHLVAPRARRRRTHHRERARTSRCCARTLCAARSSARRRTL